VKVKISIILIILIIVPDKIHQGETSSSQAIDCRKNQYNELVLLDLYHIPILVPLSTGTVSYKKFAFQKL
jgi:hypothetical protein